MSRFTSLVNTSLLFSSALICMPLASGLEVNIDKKFMNVPLLRHNNTGEFRELSILEEGELIGQFVMPYTVGKADYYSGTDMSLYQGKTLELRLSGEQGEEDLSKIIFSNEIIEDTPSYTEADRPQYHFSSRRGWINDPNGLIYADGVYHMYYQHNPFGIFWNNMSWGHATSTDLVHWTEQPNVLWPIEYGRGGMCFSGAAMLDTQNMLGKNQGDKEAIIAFYLRTGTGLCLAYSTDNGYSFTDFEGNPVIKNSGIRIDTPRPFWHEGTKRCVAPTYDSYKDEQSDQMKRCVGFYSSADLVNWTPESRVKHVGDYNVDHDELCGCVDFFTMKDPKGEEKWVMIFIDGSYIVGDFDGKTFTNAQGKPASTLDRTESLVIDNFFYATMTWHNAPHDRRVQTAWFTRGHADMGLSVFAERFTLPSELSLHEEDGQHQLRMNPIEELKSLRCHSKSLKNVNAATLNSSLSELKGKLYEFVLDVDTREGGEMHFTINGQQVVYNAKDQVVSVNGVCSPLAAIDGKISLQIFVDVNTIELYGNGGRVYIPVVCSEMHHAPVAYHLSAEGMRFPHAEIHELKSAHAKK